MNTTNYTTPATRSVRLPLGSGVEVEMEVTEHSVILYTTVMGDDGKRLRVVCSDLSKSELRAEILREKTSA